MREQLIIWLFILAIQGNFFAQNNAHSIRPADRVQERLASFSQQDPTPLFTRSPNRQRPTLAMTEYEIFQLDNERSASLHYRAPETLSLDVPFGGGPDLRLQLVRVDRPEPLVFESATQAPATVARAVHYQGIVAGDPTSLVALSVLENEVVGLISSTTLGGNWILGKLPPTGSRSPETTDYVFYQDQELFREQTFSCATPDSGEAYLREELDELAAGARNPNDCVQIYFEVNYDIFQDKGTTAATVQYVEALFNQVAALYANEQVNLTISEIFVWNTPSPFNSTSSGQMLTDFQNYRTSFNGDLAQLLSYRASGGIAVVNGLCHPYNVAKMSYSGIASTFQQVPTYSWSVMVVTHELGHLLGSQHTHACVWNGNSTAIDGCPGYTEGGCASPGLPTGGGTIMSYCHLSQVGINLSQGFGPQPGNLIRSRVAAATCLSACPTNPGGGGNPPPPPPPPPPVTGCSQEKLYLRLKLDTYSPETTWALTNAQGGVVAQGGPYAKTLANRLVLDTLCLPRGCYNFRINDAYNDGICCSYGQGNYLLTDAQQRVLAQGGAFPGSETTSLCLPYVPNTGGGDCEAIDFSAVTINSYGVNQDAGQYTVMDAGQTLYIANNAWKAIHMTYEITRNTMVAFDFKSSREGEIHGLGFDNDDGISYGYTFKVHGTQNWGISNFDNYAGGSAWQSYTIPVGEFYVGTASRFFFCADQDGGTRNGNAWFRNVRIFEGTDCQTGNLTPLTGQAAPAAESLAVWVYPNPVTSGQLQLQVDHPTTGVANWQILTLTGQVLQEQELTVDQQTYQQNISISALARGTYLLRWRDQGREQTVRFTVQ